MGLQNFVTTFYLELLQTFLAAVDAFNNRHWDKLRLLLDPDVILNKIDDPVGDQILIGIDDVMNYVETDVAADEPQFTPKTINVHPRIGVVSGIACWLDHDKDQNNNTVTTDRPITYSFGFTLRRPKPKASRQWFIVNLYGSPD